MLYQVRVLNPKGDLKNTVPSDELHKLHWKNFQTAEDNITLTSSGRLGVPKWVRQRLDLEHPDPVDSICFF